MKHVESAFLGLIVAGVLMMIVGVGLMMSPARSSFFPHSQVTFAEKRAVERAPAYAAGASGDQGAASPTR